MSDSNELPQGFKMTELGPLPEEWDAIRSVEKLLLSDSGVWGDDLGEGESGIEVLRSTNMQDNEWVFEDVARRRITEEQFRRYWLRRGDILITKSSGSKKHIGKAAYVDNVMEDRKCVFANFMQRLRFNDDVYPKYAFYFIISEDGKNTLLSRSTTTTGLRNLQKTDFENIIMPLPPISEQRAIAHVLSTIRRAIETQDKLISAARELKKSLMRHLFTYGPLPISEVNQVELKETEAGAIPDHWDTRPLGEVCKVKGGKRLPKGHVFSNKITPHPYIRIVDFKANSIDMSDIRYLAEEDYRAIKSYIIESRDVYISIAGTTGLVGCIPTSLNGANLTENAARIVIVNEASLFRDYLMYFLASFPGQTQIATQTTKTSQPKLALSRIQKISLALPPFIKQKEIAAILYAIDAKIQAEENRKSALQTLFKTMLHLLMTGQLRVKDLQIEN